MLPYFLFFFYLLCGTILLHWIIRIGKFPFTIYHTWAILFFKIFMGCLYGWTFLHFYGGDDTWNFFNESKAETDLLLRNPTHFFDEFLPGYSLQFSGHHTWSAFLFYVNHFERWFIIKGLALLNLVSGKNYYIDVLWFEFFTIPGPLLLYKLLAKDFPLRAGVNFLLVFFIPSVIFWCSGIRAEGIILFFTMLMIFNGEAYARKPSWLHAAGILAGFTGLLLFRYQFLTLFVLPFIAFSISIHKKVYSPVFFIRMFAVVGIIFFLSLFLPPDYQLSRPIQHAQESFFHLQGNTRYVLDSLKPGPISFIKIAPQAISNSSLRPYPWEGKSLLQSVSSVDVILLIAGLLYFLTVPERKKSVSHPLYWLFLFYSICLLIGIGYTVPFPGAIVRYRCIPFLLIYIFLFSGNPLLQQKLRYRIFKLH